MIVYGRNSVEESINGNFSILEVWVDRCKKNKFACILSALKDRMITVTFTSSEKLNQIASSQKHQGIAARIVLPTNIVTEDRDFSLDYHNVSRVLLLDGVTDTGNLGAVIRSAVLLGAEWILLPKDNAARITPQTIRASAGAIYKINLAYVDNLKTELRKMQEELFEICALVPHATQSIADFVSPKSKSAIIVGSEDKGIRKGIRNLCTAELFIPSTRKIDSFNVAVAAALAMDRLWLTK